MFLISWNKLVFFEIYFYLPKLTFFGNRQQSNAHAGQIKKHFFVMCWLNLMRALIKNREHNITAALQGQLQSVLWYTRLSCQARQSHAIVGHNRTVPSKHKTFVWHLYSVGPIRRWSNIVQMFWVYWVSRLSGQEYRSHVGNSRREQRPDRSWLPFTTRDDPLSCTE